MFPDDLLLHRLFAKYMLLGKLPTTLAFPASFYKGLDEFEADLDPKQIEKLLVFFEVISTQEKISKVKDTTQKQEERKLYFASIL